MLWLLCISIVNWYYIIISYEAKILSLYQMPERLKTDELKGSEEMLSNQMLSGIPEVDLGME